MSEKILYPVFGSQSITAVLDHLKNVEMTFTSRSKLALELMRKFLPFSLRLLLINKLVK